MVGSSLGTECEVLLTEIEDQSGKEVGKGSAQKVDHVMQRHAPGGEGGFLASTRRITPGRGMTPKKSRLGARASAARGAGRR